MAKINDDVVLNLMRYPNSSQCESENTQPYISLPLVLRQTTVYDDITLAVDVWN